jgi:hypothetical protein
VSPGGWERRDSEDAVLQKITVANYRQDPYYAVIVKAVEGLLREKGFVAPLELFVRMDLLSPESVENLEARPGCVSREGHSLQSRQGQPNLAYFADARARSGSQALAHRVQTMDQGLSPPLAVFKDRRPQY